MSESIDKIENRRKALQEYLKGLQQRVDVLNTEAFQSFLDLDAYVSLELAKPKLLTEFINLGLPVSNMLFLEKHKVLFLAYEKKNIKAKIENLFSVFNVREKTEEGSINGGIGCYK